MRRIAVVLFSLMVFMMVAPASWAGERQAVRDALQAGGDRLVQLQNVDGGWFFFVVDTNCGLEPGVSCPNTFGVTALGLLASYDRTHDADHLAAATRTANALVAKHAAGPACDGNPATGADRPFTVDLSFLETLVQVGNRHGAAGQVFRDTAVSWFQCVKADFPTGASRADNRINGRIAQGLNNLGAWDAALDVRAALSLGERAYALAEARQIIAREADWDVADPDCAGCELLAKGLFLAATKELAHHTDIRAAQSRWRDDLLLSQLPDGSWAGDTQITAYVVMGLSAGGGRGVEDAVKQAVDFLLSMKNPSGGFGIGVGFEGLEVTEVDGEALQALQAARGED